MRSLRRFFVLLILLMLAVPVLYGLAALALGSLPGPHRDPLPEQASVAVYLISNGWHVWLALPVRHGDGDQATDWTDWLPPEDFATDVSGRDYVAFGWGDRDFYMATRRPIDFRPGLAFAALLGRGPAAMHVMRVPEPDAGAAAELLYRAERDGRFLRALHAACKKRAPLFDPGRERRAVLRLVDNSIKAVSRRSR